MTDEDARRLVMALLAARSSHATVCPSEVARALADASASDRTSPSWRTAMPIVHAAIDRLVAEGLVQLSWKGRSLRARAGPYRIGRVPQAFDPDVAGHR